VLGRRDAFDSSWSFAAMSARATAAGTQIAWGATDEDIWVASAGAMLHVAGGMVTSVPVAGAQTFVAVSGSSASDVWAIDEAGGVFRWNGTQWSGPSSSLPSSVDGGANHLVPAAVWVASPSEAWVVANSSTEVGSRAAVIHGDGATWTADWLGDWGTEAVSVAGTSPMDVWIAGSALWHRGSDLSWDVVSQANAQDISALCLGRSGVYWLSRGDSNAIVNRWDPGARALTSWSVPVSEDVPFATLWVGARVAGGRTSSGWPGPTAA
jgi:hypothetical protein